MIKVVDFEVPKRDQPLLAKARQLYKNGLHNAALEELAKCNRKEFAYDVARLRVRILIDLKRFAEAYDEQIKIVSYFGNGHLDEMLGKASIQRELKQYKDAVVTLTRCEESAEELLDIVRWCRSDIIKVMDKENA